MIDLSNPEAVIAESRRRAARRAQGLPFDETPKETEQRERLEDDRLESEIQAECVKEYRARGFIVYEGLKERRKTRIDKGHPDLELFHPRARWHGYHEVKTPTGKLRPDQEDFRESCLATDVPHYVGGMEACAAAIDEVSRRLEKAGEPGIPELHIEAVSRG
jgi:hypothetical protein